VCEKRIATPFKRVSNLKKHLFEHIGDNKYIREWLNLYDNRYNLHRAEISDQLLTMIKFFVTSNTSLQQIENPYLLKLFPPDMKIDKPDKFREMILKSASILHNAIENKLNEASFITLITDIWTDKQNLDYIGLAAKCIYPSYKKEIFVIGLNRMGVAHNAYNIKAKIEEMVNYYTKFDKSKIKGTF
jgi:hypothetical protein